MSVSISLGIDGPTLTQHYRSKVSVSGFAEALKVTIDETGLSEDHAMGLLEGRKKVIDRDGKPFLVDEE